MVQSLVFLVGSHRGAIPLTDADAVLHMARFVPVSRLPVGIAGLINYHKKPMAIISAGTFFDHPKTNPQSSDMLIVLRSMDRLMALWVDALVGIEEISVETDEKPSRRKLAWPTIIVTDSGIRFFQHPAEEIAARLPPVDDLNSLFTAEIAVFGVTPSHEIPSPSNQDRILEERAHILARPEELSENDRSIEILRFSISHQEFAIEMHHIKEVVLTGTITRVPGTPGYIAGICIIRGEIISLVDLRVLLPIQYSGITDLNRVIVLSGNNLMFGILADQITGIGNLDLNRLSPYPIDAQPNPMNFIKGVQEGGLSLLDVDSLLVDPRMVIEES
jgi:chemotaxis signal transduction protein